MNDLNNQQKKHVNIGLDIGTTSVGWAIIDNDYNVIDYGVRLFEDACEEKTGKTRNEFRRLHRVLRRMLRRRRHRKDRFIKLILANKNIFSFTEEKAVKELLKKETELPWNVKVCGLHSQLPKEKLIYILYHYLSHRGFSYLDYVDDSGKGSSEKVDVDYLPELIKSDPIEKQKFNRLFPSQKQKLIFDKFGYQDHNLNKTFRMSWWKDEINNVLSNQSYLSNEFKKSYLKLFETYRDYNIGPGSEKSPTPYGLWSLSYDKGFKKIFKKGDNLWDCLVGKCSWFDGSNNEKPELRIEMNSASATIFNLLNDLQNLEINNDSQCISSIQKKRIFTLLLNYDKKKQKLTRQKLAKILKCDKDDIYYRKSGKEPNFTDTNTLKFALNFLKINSVDFVEELWQKKFDYVNEVNKLVHLISTNKNSEKLYDEIVFNFPNLIRNYGYKSSDELIKNEDFINIKKNKKYSSYSEKALNMFIPYLLDDEQGHNWEFIRHRPQFVNNNVKSNKFNNKYIDINSLKINEKIFSPTVARSVRQTFKVINAILKSKKYSNYDIDNISIEMCRNNNTAETKAQEHKINNINKKKNETIKEFIGDINISKTFEREFRSKIYLALSQDWKDPYDNKNISKPEPISELELRRWSSNYEIDHIIPHSYFHDDSWANKVLTKKENNANKGDKTPYEQWGKLPIWTDMIKWFKPKKFVDKKGWVLLDDEKIANFKIGSNGEDVLGKLPERKLVDTRYTTTFVLESLIDFFNCNSYYLNRNKPGIFTINGHVTAYFRNTFAYDKKYDLNPFKKNRDNFKHHAIDAIIVALFAILPYEFVNLFRKCSSLYISNKSNNFSNDFTLEKQKALKKVIDKKLKLSESFDKEKIRKLSQWIENNEPKFSRMLITKNNCEFFNESAYSYRCDDNDNVFTKEKIGIFDSKKNKIIFDLFEGKVKQENVKCLLNHDALVLLKEIYECNKDGDKNPFQKYMEIEYKEKNPTYLKFDLNGIENKIKNISFLFRGNKKDKYFMDKKIGCIRDSFKSISIDCYKKTVIDMWYL